MKALTITKQIIGLFFVLFISLQLQAQEKTISGIITDETGTPMPGVTVVRVGTNNKTQTDFDGKYVIRASKGDC